jgi:type IV secretory pathway VirB2 component (pilin)
MKKVLELAGNLSGILGLVLCAVAGGSRLSGAYYTAGFTTTVVFNAGVGLMVAACLAKIHLLGSR